MQPDLNLRYLTTMKTVTLIRRELFKHLGYASILNFLHAYDVCIFVYFVLSIKFV